MGGMSNEKSDQGRNFWDLKMPAYCSWSWRHILKGRKAVSTIVKYCIGNGKGTMLWNDPWHHNGILKEEFL